MANSTSLNTAAPSLDPALSGNSNPAGKVGSSGLHRAQTSDPSQPSPRPPPSGASVSKASASASTSVGSAALRTRSALPGSSQLLSSLGRDAPSGREALSNRDALTTRDLGGRERTARERAQAQAQQQQQSEDERAETQWRAMQATLAEVELSAAGAKTFFGPAHSAALDELRAAQVALASAWARGEAPADGAGEAPAASVRSGVSPGSEDGEDLAGGGAADDAERDMETARRRREANGRYFDRVSRSVQDVVASLEGVAGAMGKVEREAREVWSESGSESLSAEGGSLEE